MPPPEANQAPVFLFGVTRSGTTLLARMLDLHPNLSIYIESRYLHVVADRDPCEPLATDAAALEILGRVGDLEKEGVEAASVLARFAATDRSPRSLFDAILRCRMEARGKRRYGEKTPSHFLRLDLLLDWYPSARLVFLRRDPRSIHASYKNSRDYLQDGWLDRTVVGRSLYWNLYQRVLREAKRRRPGQLFEVQLEELIGDPESILRSLCVFLGEPFDQRMLEVVENNSSFPETRPLPGLRPEAADRRHRITRFETGVIELLGGQAILEEGRSLTSVPKTLVRSLSALGFYTACGGAHAAVRRLRRGR